mmetsp:Transcript_14459/g.23955  ORF Transcript_14459/g.23955 Transcript_14459/m.23955 type:complete len:628 (+) Transcript_14459:843-2726(+)
MPCHGRKYHSDQLRDNFPDGDPNGVNVEGTLTRLYDANVEYYFGRLTEHTDQMIRVFNQHFAKEVYMKNLDIDTDDSHGEEETLKLSDDDASDGDASDDVQKESETGDQYGSKISNNKEDEKGIDEENDDDSFYDEFDDNDDSECDEEGYGDYVKEIDITDPSLLLHTITARVTQSMTQSLTTSFSTHATEEGELNSLFGALNLKTPKWRLLSSEPGRLCEIPFPESMDEIMTDPATLMETRNTVFEPIHASLRTPIQNSTTNEQSKHASSLGLVSNREAEETLCDVKLGAEPFARGSCRNAFKARITSKQPMNRFRSRLRSSKTSDSMSFDLTGIVKSTFSPNSTSPLSMEDSKLVRPTYPNDFTCKYSSALKLQHPYVVAAYMANEFNKQLRESGKGQLKQASATPRVVYNPVTLLHLPSRLDSSTQFATIEHDITKPRHSSELLAMQSRTFLESSQFITHTTSTVTGEEKSNTMKIKFEKYNGNHGLCVPNPTPYGTDHSVVQAFSHWTYEASKGAVLVVDCQGAYHANEEGEGEGGMFLLTDPAIHCVDVMKFGVGVLQTSITCFLIINIMKTALLSGLYREPTWEMKASKGSSKRINATVTAQLCIFLLERTLKTPSPAKEG